MLPWSSLSLVAASVVPLAAAAPEDGIGASRGDPMLPPPSAFAVAPAQTQAAKRGRVFVNFDGAVLGDESEDARINQTKIGFTGAFEGYGAGAKRDAVMQAFASDWQAYDVELTQSRPDAGEYTMAMVGPTNFTGTALGVALLDCEDKWTHNNVVYAFHNVDDNFSASATATTISQEVAHSYGLEHVDEPDDVMNPLNEGGDPGFLDDCIDIVPADFGILCEDQHERQCGVTNKQNAHRELLHLFGTSGPDTLAPTVSIAAPTDGDVFDIGASFEVTVDADDNREIATLRLLSGGQEIAQDTEAPFGWRVEDAPEGEYRFVVEAVDAAGNMGASEEIVVAVAAGGDPGVPDSGDDDPLDPVDPEPSGESGEGDPRGDGFDDDGWPLPDDAVDRSKDRRYSALDDTGCRVVDPAPHGMLALLLLGLVRRRRARS